MKSQLISALALTLIVAGAASCNKPYKVIETNDRGVPLNIADIVMGDDYAIDTLYTSDAGDVLNIVNRAYCQNIVYTGDEILVNSPTLMIDSIQWGVYEFKDLLRSAKVNFADAQSVDNLKREFPQYPQFSTVAVGDTSAVGQQAVFAYAVSVPDQKVKCREGMLHWIERCLNDSMAYNSNVKDFGRRMETTFFDSFPKRESEFTYTNSRSMLVYYLSDSYVTYYDFFWGFLGGAHGMYCYRFVSYSLSDDCAVTPAYLFTPGSEDAIRELIYESLAADEDFTSAHHLTSLSQVRTYVQSYLEDEPLPIPEPGILPQGVVFCYQPYEIGCYADGAFQLVIPWESIRPYLAVNI